MDTSAEQLRFPVIMFHKDFAGMVENLDELTTTTAYGLKKGKYNDLLVVDSRGISRHVREARKVAGVGRFGGWNIFLNQRLRVELVFDGEPSQMSVDQLKQRLYRSFEEWHGWEASTRFDELRESIDSASSIGQIFAALSA